MNPRRRIRGLVAVALAAMGIGAGAAAAPRPGWSHPTSGGPWGLAADRAGAVVVTDRPAVLALDRAGHVRWSASVDSLVEAKPAMGGGRVLVGGRGLVTELSRATGARGWQQAMDGDVTSVALVGDLALAGDHAGTLVAFDARTGDRRWSARFDGRPWSAPQIARASGSAVLTWHGDAVTSTARAFDLATGKVRWEAPIGACAGAPVVEGDAVVLPIGDCHHHARVEARDLASGIVRWRAAVPASFEETIQPAADDRDVAVVDHFGVVTLLDRETGELRWRRDVGYALLDTRMSLTRRRVVFRSFSGDIFVLARADGHIVARISEHQLGGYPVATLLPPWPGPDQLLVALRLASFRVDLRALP